MPLKSQNYLTPSSPISVAPSVTIPQILLSDLFFSGYNSPSPQWTGLHIGPFECV